MTNLNNRQKLPEKSNWNQLKIFLESTELSEIPKKKLFNNSYNDNLNVLQNLDIFLDPIENKFRLLNSIQINKIFKHIDPEISSHARDCFMEDPVLLIKYELYQSFLYTHIQKNL
jgi:hypothetical protein